MHFSHHEGLFCPSFFEKMQKNAFFFAKYLVMCIFCCTFAPLFRRRVKRRGKKSEKRPASLAQLARARDL